MSQNASLSAGSAALRLPSRVLITGGSTGIGFACAQLFRRAGASVGLIGRSGPGLERASAALREDDGGATGAIATASASVSDERAISSAVDGIAEEIGGLDAIVLSAGVDGELGSLVSEVTADSFREVLETNVLGAFLTVRSALPHLRRSVDATITIIGSDSGFVAVPGMLAYNASKGAIVQLTRALAVELYETDGIRVNSVAPSVVDTPMARRGLGDEVMDAPPFPLQSAEDVAWSVAYLSSGQARAVNGASLLSDFGYTGRSSFPA
ncbi:SDR family oxidoreductase [Mycobacterium sp. CBMA247]|nr:SDR family oxidoreductase [Mycolicibacterium sp. CBMA 329]MUL89308.1 SDR family oxidoreductase [Mycolicibacterium sp. CBMA 331]MUM02775.1 SDR family oxidoreductase [Mycolicibacterium sp. CBMA 334]MUM38824.1 SDR family oxidoreductase [Mycolicibacterium sp. CBMA 247]MUM45372.1 SDR family oxidoreductase [Mycolicibacterium sp. CBMA 294]